MEEATSSQGPTFAPSRAKINSIRNPVLRYMAKALVCFPFAHKELGSISSEILFILWGMLAHRRVNTGYFMIKHLERHTKKKSGKLCCGGVITRLAHHFDVDIEERDPDTGSMWIDWDILRRSGMIAVDGRGAGYFVLGPNTFFRFPSPQLTAVGGWTYQANWKMNSDDHFARIASDPPQGEGFSGQQPMRVGPHQFPRPEIPDEPLPIQDIEQAREAEEVEEEEDEEEAESSQPKRKRPVGRPSRDSQLSEIVAGIRSMRLEQANQRGQLLQLREDHQVWRAQQESRLDVFGERIDHLQAQGDARWAEEQAFYRAYYARFPPPSD